MIIIIIIVRVHWIGWNVRLSTHHLFLCFYFLIPSMEIRIYALFFSFHIWLCRWGSATEEKKKLTENFRRHTKSLRLSERTATECFLNGIAWMFKAIPSSYRCATIARARTHCSGYYAWRNVYLMIKTSGDDVDGDRAACTGASMCKHSKS